MKLNPVDESPLSKDGDSSEISDEIECKVPQTRKSIKKLVDVVKKLSLARNIETVTEIIQRAAREFTSADGATFVLRDRDQCYYAEENAIQPLWKGMRFPMTACVSGWSMLNGKIAAISDIYQDDRVPHDVYRSTFVKSLIMVPVRPENPIAAIGNYWSEKRKATPEEIEILQILADATSIALENVQLYLELEQRVQERTRQIEEANKHLESFAYSISHDLRNPLCVISGFSRILIEDFSEKLGEKEKKYLSSILKEAGHMEKMIAAILNLSRISQQELKTEPYINLSKIAREIIEDLKATSPERNVSVSVQDNLVVEGDKILLKSVMQNLLENAWKYSSKNPNATIEFGKINSDGGETYFIRDNGVGFDMAEANQLFKEFTRMRNATEFQGTGVGLSIVSKIITKHHGKIWAEARLGEGATFFFTLKKGPV